MVRKEIIDIVRLYLKDLSLNGIDIKKAILFGSQARGNFHKDSDIDLMIISPIFDNNFDEYLSRIWFLTKNAGYKIEPVPVGEKKFLEDDVSPLLEMVRREGIEVYYE
jgi:predicted nucleotidyltransferase